MAHLKDLERQLMALKKQIPFATARALTSTARKIQEAQKDNLQSRLDNPTPFTVNSVASTAARKTNLNAKVLIRPTAAEYLAPRSLAAHGTLAVTLCSTPKASGFWQRKKYQPLTGKKS
ncbi:hypothetical protein CJJ19_02955 [Candidatus Williamhamiltonella defendens]|nr:hypothetical protein [Candidatus Hamiltonella defensa]AYB48616.1 hypothetical protein CJJ19_02955 [Candidatus Hamiltonella defensa]